MQEEERKPDLEGADSEAAEEKVKKLLEPDDDDSKKSAQVNGSKQPESSNDQDEKTDDMIEEKPEADGPPSAPELPVSDKKAKSIPVASHSEADDPIKDELLEDDVTVVDLDNASTEKGKELLQSVDTEESNGNGTETEKTPAEHEKTKDLRSAKDTDTDPYDDEATADAVRDIIAKESDEILAVQDKKIADVQPAKKKQKGILKRTLKSPKFWIVVIAFVFIGFAVSMVVPASRYYLLNYAGVRSKASLMVIDESTLQPLKNVEVKIAGESGVTNESGEVVIEELKLGPTQLEIERRAFETNRQDITIGWGSNPLGEYELKPTGMQYTFIVKDYLSEKPGRKAEATVGSSSAFADEEGKIKLTLEDTEEESFDVEIFKEDFRKETITVEVGSQEEFEVLLVPDRRHVFISNRSGTYDVYKIDIDGENEERVFAGTGSERQDMVLLPNPTNEFAALVSTRDNKRNSEGQLMSTLTIINIETGETLEVAESERLQIVDWVGDELVFLQLTSGADTDDPARHKLIGYNVRNVMPRELASSNFFNDVLSMDGIIYYAPSSAYQEDGFAKLYSIELALGKYKTVLDKEVWSLFRSDYDYLEMSAQDMWYRYEVENAEIKELQGQPANPVDRTYVDSPDGERSLWVDMRDGKGALLVHVRDSGNEQIIRSESGLKYPVRWLSDSVIVYRIDTDQETADYIISLDGGEPKKLKDVSNTGGFDQWYFY
jgi:hypothetical protein